MNNCTHDKFAGNVDVSRLTSRGQFLAHITIWCAQCQERFTFVGAERQAAPSLDHVSVNLDRSTLRAPIVAAGHIFLPGR